MAMSNTLTKSDGAAKLPGGNSGPNPNIGDNTPKRTEQEIRAKEVSGAGVGTNANPTYPPGVTSDHF